MEANAMVQMALLAVLPLVMQGLKKILWVENNKAWLCPLLCITAATATAYFMQLPQWLMVGIITGAACNKIYDWGKDLKNATMILLILLLPILVFAGCGGQNQTLSQKGDILKATDGSFVAAIKVVTVLKTVPGTFNQEDVNVINILIHRGQSCLNNEANWLKDPNGPEPAWFDCAINTTQDLLAYAAKKGGKQ